jgi:hypothetical protein
MFTSKINQRISVNSDYCRIKTFTRLMRSSDMMKYHFNKKYEAHGRLKKLQLIKKNVTYHILNQEVQ